ncbi:uncharacterized protein PITG_17337 [Phytophthora infestans T30-4]|uniref:Uncharacterized protein n=1 Tax=Phytophthora infestans (strain T30-4) TaxID=403677 RepID=D0NVU4_PHYIT|nr:uncharacterized protein PITG_17337 [Phytophthora infestans T30-4]EEY66775.1 hypothetical protein PITG_17337 [Phytophthora infestans T30-4]|eukprot:XP_002896840.1 hypothetical protein PITG_17337 [Phytophthora infestans T30-4]
MAGRGLYALSHFSKYNVKLSASSPLQPEYQEVHASATLPNTTPGFFPTLTDNHKIKRLQWVLCHVDLPLD